MSIVYISLGKSLLKQRPNFDMPSFLKQLAQCVNVDYDGKPLIENGQVCKKRLVNYLVEKTNYFLSDFKRLESDINMRPTVSKAQVSRLLNLFSRKRCRVSCYSVVILHVMLEEFRKNNTSIAEPLLLSFANTVKDLCELYARFYPDDPLVQYILDCHTILFQELSHVIEKASASDFPEILQKKVDYPQDE